MPSVLAASLQQLQALSAARLSAKTGSLEYPPEGRGILLGDFSCFKVTNILFPNIHLPHDVNLQFVRRYPFPECLDETH